MKSTPVRAGATAVVLAGGIYGWALVVLGFAHNGVIGPKFLPLGSDFMVYYAAAKAALAGQVAGIFDVARFTDAQNALFAGWLPEPLSFRPWLYPPQFLILLLPFGLLPPVAALIVFLTGTFAVFAWALWPRGSSWRCPAALLLSPATARTVIAGQNSFLTAGLLIGGFRLRRSYPTLAGVLLGVLAFKPQLACLVPIALAASRDWRTLAVAAATCALLIAGSIAAFGVAPWQLWLHLATNLSGGFAESWQETALLHGASPFVVVIAFGGRLGAAIAVQAVVAALCAALVILVYARRLPQELQLSILLTCTVLADPHLQGYDLTLLMGAVVLSVPGLLEKPLPGEAAVMALAWLTPFVSYGISGNLDTLLACSLIVAVLGYRLARAAAMLRSD